LRCPKSNCASGALTQLSQKKSRKARNYKVV
jgi:hypothetical protein